MQKSFLICLVFLLTALVQAKAQTLSGTAFEDRNGNGRWDPKEVGVSGVLISNGLDVVPTDADGRFHLQRHPRTRFLSLVVPSEYELERFFLAATSERQGYDFALRPKARLESVAFVHISDTETFEMSRWIDDLKGLIRDLRPAFLMHTGDAIGLQFHSDQLSSAAMGARTLYSMGNHDLTAGAYGEELYENLFGPTWYAFEEGDVLFVVTPMLYGDFEPSFTLSDVYGWLSALLSHYPARKPKVFFSHHLPPSRGRLYFVPSSDDKLHYFGVGEEKIDLAAQGMKAWFHGHSHSNHVHRHVAATSYSTASVVKGGIDHSPSVFRTVRVEAGGEITSELRYSHVERQITVVTPKEGQVAGLSNGTLPVSVNSYRSSAPTRSVRYSISLSKDRDPIRSGEVEEKWHEMEQKSDWNWAARWQVPDDAAGRKYRLEVEAYTADGRVMTQERTFTFEPNQKEVWIGDPWPNLLHNAAHTGDPERALELPLQIKWIENVGANIFMTSPLVAEGKVFVATVDDANGTQGALVALDATEGRIAWRYSTGNSIRNTIVYAEGKVIATDVAGTTYAIHANTGALAWKREPSMRRPQAYAAGNVTAEGLVYAGFGKNLSALRVADGESVWRNSAWDLGHGSVATMTLGGGVLVASAQWNGLFGHDAETGTLLWSQKTESLRFRDGSAAFYQGSLYVGSRRKVFVLDARSGEILQQAETGFQHEAATTPVVTGDAIYLGTADKGLLALSRSDLTPLWSLETGEALFYTVPYSSRGERSVETAPVLSGRQLFFGASDGVFYAVNKDSGSVTWKMELGAPIFSSAAISGNLLFLADFAGNVYAFSGGRAELAPMESERGSAPVAPRSQATKLSCSARY